MLNVKLTHPGQRVLKCISGDLAMEARENGINLIDRVMDLNDQCEMLFGNEDQEEALAKSDPETAEEVVRAIGTVVERG